MPASKKKNTYNKAKKILFYMFLGLMIANVVLKDVWTNSALYLTLVSAVFSLISGYVAFLHSKLPKAEREPANWLSFSSFNIHPYITFILFILLSVIGLCYLLKN